MDTLSAVPDKLSRRLVELRYRAKLSQRDLAERAGLSNSTVSRIESGRTPSPGIAVLRRLARALDATLTDLLAGSEE